MNILYAMMLSLIAGLSTLIGALFIFFPISKENINKFISFCLAFSVSIMIGISIFDLLTESIILIFNKYNILSVLIIFISFVLAYIIIKILDLLLKKYENNLYKLGILSMITLIMHNLPEGVLTFLSSYMDRTLGLKLTFAIALHNIPEGIAIAVPIYYSTKSKTKALLNTFISGLSEPLGALLAYLFIYRFVNNIVMSIILLIVSFLMITLAIEQLFPQAIKYKENKMVLYGLFIGLIIILITLVI